MDSFQVQRELKLAVLVLLDTSQIQLVSGSVNNAAGDKRLLSYCFIVDGLTSSLLLSLADPNVMPGHSLSS